MFTTTTKQQQQQQRVNEDRWSFVIMFVDSDTVNTKNKTSVLLSFYVLSEGHFTFFRFHHSIYAI